MDLLFVLEEEISPSCFSIHRLAHYCLELSELCKTDRVVPVVIFLHRAQAAAKQLILGTEFLTYLTFNYLKYDLASTK